MVGYGTVRKGSVTGALSVVKTSYLQRVKDYFVKDSIKVFPNPAKAGNQIRIEWKKAPEGEYVIDLYNLQGQLIKSSFARIENEMNPFTFPIPVITPGSYLLQMTNKKSGKKHTEKIIIQYAVILLGEFLLQIEKSITIFKPELLAKQSFLSHNTKSPRIAGGIFFVSLLNRIGIVQECDPSLRTG